MKFLSHIKAQHRLCNLMCPPFAPQPQEYELEGDGQECEDEGNAYSLHTKLV